MIRLVIASVLAATAAVGFVSVVSAQQQDPIAARRTIMKSLGEQAAIGAKMGRGEEPFTIEKARRVFATYQRIAETHTLWPDTSKTGGETAALPAIWENKADFEARLAKTAADAKAAEASVTDLESFKTQVTEVQKNCGGCHQTYRVRRS
ncbi:MAG: hypothetical protein QOD74_2131 [Variibacter sp.]|jgi:cytochrome c556|nr:hypothetical protein [Variibacter sp.]